jgi:hypothetical protein
MHRVQTRFALPRLPLILAVAAAVTVSLAGPALPGERPGIAIEELFPDARFDPAIPTIEAIAGIRPGERPLRHGELLAYLRALDAASPRATMGVYSATHEGRPMVWFAVSDEATVADLEGFRRAHADRVDPRGRSAADDAAALEGAKAVAWMAYGIHGDELSSTDAAAALAYRLVAGEDERAQAMRRGLVVLIDPCENPDGRERYLAMTTAFAHKTPNPDTEDLSHTAVWPWGRGNHYLFDLNRDWISMVQPESRRTTVIASWNPQLMVDSHEMGSHDSYLFSPSRHPFNPFLPASNQAWAARFAADQASALDRHGYPYYTREWNEEFFPGYGSAWAQYLGAVGILYEMSGTEGTLVKRRSSGVRTFGEAVEHQVTSSMANLGTLLENREALLADFVADRRAFIARAGDGEPAAWVLSRRPDPQRSDRLVELLRAQGIEVLRGFSGCAELRGLRDSRSGASVDTGELGDDCWLVPLDQPAAPLARNLLDPHLPMNAEFLSEEREYQERGKGTRLYETTAWSLPFAFDVHAYWTAETPGKEGWHEGPFDVVPWHPFEADPAAVAFLISGHGDRSTAVLADLLQRGLEVRVAEKPFAVGGRDWKTGALLVRREGNPDDLESQLTEVAERHAVEITAVTTAKAEQGPDLGGNRFRPLVEPRVGIFTGWPVSPSSYGELWHLLDEELGLRFNGLDLGRFNRVDLSRYNVLVFPPVWGGYRASIGEGGVKKIKQWIEGGGTAIGIGGGADFLSDEATGITRTRPRRQALEQYPPVVLGLPAEQALIAGTFRAVGLRAPAESKKSDDDGDGGKSGGKGKKSAAPESAAASPYDVAPLLGAGARPFVAGYEQGTPASAEPVDLATWLRPFLPPGKGKPSKEDLERADGRLRRFMPRGAFLRVELDPEIWLGWGAPAELPALIRARDSLVAEPPVQVAARFADVERLHLGGLLWPEAAGRLAHTAYATRESRGRGQVILFADDPVFRGWTLGTRRMLINALLYGPGLGTRWSTPW